MSSKACRTVLLPEPESPVRMTSWPGRRREVASLFAGRRLVFDTALMRAGDTHVFAIFGNGAASDVDAVVVELLGDLLVGKRLGGVFFFNHFLDQPLQREQRHPAALRAIYCFAEE